MRIHIYVAVMLSSLLPAGCGIDAAIYYGVVDAQKKAERERKNAEARANVPTALGIYYSITNGKVGHHVYSEPRAYCGIDGEYWNSTSATLVGGQLPPGMSMDGSRVRGTPDQPGRWVATIRFTGLGCRGKTYPDQDVTFDFTVQGDAVKGL